jgi:CheY-like chemotaxis protein
MLKKFWYLFLVLLVEGSSLIAAELLGARLPAPLTLPGAKHKPMRKFLLPVKAIILVVILLFSVSFAKATTYYWTGTTSNAWATTTNWNPNGNPGSAAGDIVLMDIHMPRQNGIDATKLIKNRLLSTKVFILSMDPSEFYRKNTQEFADGFIAKTSIKNALLSVLTSEQESHMQPMAANAYAA